MLGHEKRQKYIRSFSGNYCGRITRVFFSTTNNLSGQAIKAPEPACAYETDLETYVQTAPNPTGNNYCKSKGYAYAALVDRSASRILFDSTNGQCFIGGNIQVDEIKYTYTLSGYVPLKGWSKSSCVLQNNQGFVEPEYGDAFTIQAYEGALCCEL
ncbi:MAG: hypothetical protein AABW64_02010 [Nanoarchaeota archaeon]